MSKPTVQSLLSKPPDEIVSTLGSIYEHSAWVAEVLAKSPSLTSIDTVSVLAATMKAIVDDATQEKKLELLCAHPDLCQKVGKLKELTTDSQDEQSRSGLQSLTDEENERFNKLNNAYRDKFKFPFILAVRNATKYTVLAALEGRVKHSREKEFVTALEQVHKIAWMRLLTKFDLKEAKGFLTCHVLDTANGCPGKCTPARTITDRPRGLTFTVREGSRLWHSGEDAHYVASSVSTRVGWFGGRIRDQ